MAQKALVVGVSVVAILAIVVLIMDRSVSKPPAQRAANTMVATPEAAADPNAASAPALRKLAMLDRVPDFTLTDEKGEPFGLDQLLGRVWVAAFDPPAGTKLRTPVLDVLGQIQDFHRQAVAPENLYFVNFQVSTDAVAADSDQSGAPGGTGRIKSLSGTVEQIEALRQSGLGAGAREADASTVMLTLVDPQGYVRAHCDGLSAYSRGDLIRDLRTALDERVLMPPLSIEPSWLANRRDAQLAQRDKLEVFSAFTFRDRVKESGITFRHRIVDDAGRMLITAHYDHGNGLAIADVDNDKLHDLVFVNQVGRSELWRNLGEGRFENITEAAGIGVSNRIGVTASFADIDNDGDPDLYLTTVRGGNLLYENDGSGHFQDITANSGVGYNGHSSSAEFFDYDHDGLLDLFLVNVGVYTTEQVAVVENDSVTGPDRETYSYYVSNADAFAAHLKPPRAERSLLFRNLGGNRFEDVTDATQLVDFSWTGDASPLDANLDGWPDLYLVNMQGHDEYWENVEGKHFVKRSRELFPATPWGSMGIKVFDFDNDGRMDIYVTDMHTDMAQDLEPAQEKNKILKDALDPTMLATDGNHVLGNAFYHREENGQYTEISERINAENYWPWGLSVGDLNADGFQDVFITACMNFPYRYATNSLLLNDRGRTFIDSEFLLGAEPRRGGRTAVPWFELDVEGKDREHPVVKSLSNKGLNVAKPVIWGAVGSRSSVIFDLDNDGDLDIVTNDFNSEPMVLISDLTERQSATHYLKIKLIGGPSNRDGLGAVVRVKAARDVFTQAYDGQSGYLSQSTYPLYFGLGKHEQIDEIQIDWPSGQRQVMPGPLPSNVTMEITESDAP